MLVLTLKENDDLLIRPALGPPIIIRLVRATKHTSRIGIIADKSVTVLRAEILDHRDKKNHKGIYEAALAKDNPQRKATPNA